MQLKRVVVTGLGALTPIGNSIQEYWDGLVNGFRAESDVYTYLLKYTVNNIKNIKVGDITVLK